MLYFIVPKSLCILAVSPSDLEGEFIDVELHTYSMANGFESQPDFTNEDCGHKETFEHSPEILVSNIHSKKPKMGVLKKIQFTISRMFTAKV